MRPVHTSTNVDPILSAIYQGSNERRYPEIDGNQNGTYSEINKDKADENIARIKEEIEDINDKLAHIIDYTINWYEMLKEKYGKNYPRRTELRNFDTIEAAKVVEANEKLYINREEGFIGTSLKKDEFVANCSDIDDVIIFYKDGKYKVVRVTDKMFVGKNVLYVNVFQKERQTYHLQCGVSRRKRRISLYKAIQYHFDYP